MTSDEPRQDRSNDDGDRHSVADATVKVATTPAPGSGDERFTPGTLLSERYRIIARLGQGGMGEVYRADDLKLGQSVALKFLPPAVATDPSWLRRLHDEVRIAREVAHPNVCRTYDIGEVDGDHFITMEYVDGEDLSALLRRIGRLPPDKAVEIARQLCAGLAAAHEKGVLHRDLKPANVMLDGRGKVRVTDFGIAAIADNIEPGDIRTGTPYYMAPEQLEGEAVTARSDIYSLGLVLYEVYTGREAFHADTLAQLKDLRRSSVLSTPSSLVADIDPTVERVIMRCLENDPADRPGSAIAVAAALPGGDPLAMALAAGETPSPEMVVQAGERGALRPAVALSLGAALLVLLGLATYGRDQVRVERFVDMDLPPAVLAHRAGEIVATLGHTDAPMETHSALRTHFRPRDWIQEHDTEPGRWQRAADLGIDLVHFEWRSAPRKMTPRNWAGVVRWNDPPHMEPGMIRLRLDPGGRLVGLDVVPEALTPDSGETAPREMDWGPLLADTGIPTAELEPVEPARTPPHAFDARAAWRWTGPGSDTCPLRLEAAAWRGRPVWLTRIRPWDEPTDDGATASSAPPAVVVWLLVLFVSSPLVGAVVLAARNIRAGRGDRRGAFRLALFFLAVSLGQWLFLSDRWLSNDGFPLAPWALAFGRAASISIMVWLFYLAIEPFARRHWPRTIVSWTRLLAGRWRDPMVGRDILYGSVAGGLLMALVSALSALRPLLGAPIDNPLYAWSNTSLGGRHAIGGLLYPATSVAQFIGFFVLLLLARLLLRRTWLAVVVLLGALALFAVAISDDAIVVAQNLILFALVTVFAVRFGLLAVATFAVAMSLLSSYPTTIDMSAWYASAGLVGPVALLALAGFGLWTSLAGQPIFRDHV